jgi:hypothetical protein
VRYIFITPSAVIDSSTGESLELEQLEKVMMEKPGGIIAGNNLYPVLARLVPMVKSDHGWSASLKVQQKRKLKSERVGGVIYFTRMTYRFPKERVAKNHRYRPGSIKWLILNLELFCETDDVAGAAKALVELAEKRGIKARHSPGAFGGALLRASPEWSTKRQPAPWFISEKARHYLPGNYYCLRDGYRMKTVPRAYYIDQRSSHHTIASTVMLPDPRHLRARGRLRSVEKGQAPYWIDGNNVQRIFDNHTGLLCAVVECDLMPRSIEHLYPPWAKRRGEHTVWIWTPELRLLDRRVRLRWVSAALTSYKCDPALNEYARWALDQLTHKHHNAIKPALLAAYGLLGVKSTGDIEKYSMSGRDAPVRSEVCKLPLIGECYRSTVTNTRVSAIQNVVARGVIEAETRTRSIEYARNLEEIGIHVCQIYADGVIAATDALPFVPKEWRIAGELTNVRSPSANTIISDNLYRMPGIPGGRRSAEIRRHAA